MTLFREFQFPLITRGLFLSTCFFKWFPENFLMPIDDYIERKFLLHLPNPYKPTTCISRWNDVETVISTSFWRGIHVVRL